MPKPQDFKILDDGQLESLVGDKRIAPVHGTIRLVCICDGTKFWWLPEHSDPNNPDFPSLEDAVKGMQKLYEGTRIEPVTTYAFDEKGKCKFHLGVGSVADGPDEP